MNINEKELVKQIKASKNHLIWSVQDNVHYITNRYWAVRYEKLPTVILTALFSIFAEIPGTNSSIQTIGGSVTKPDIVDIRKVMDTKREERIGELTNVLINERHGKYTLRVINCSGDLIFVRDDYINMVEGTCNPVCSGIRQPVTFCNGDLLILPVRVEKVTQKEVIQELIETL